MFLPIVQLICITTTKSMSVKHSAKSVEEEPGLPLPVSGPFLNLLMAQLLSQGRNSFNSSASAVIIRNQIYLSIIGRGPSNTCFYKTNYRWVDGGSIGYEVGGKIPAPTTCFNTALFLLECVDINTEFHFLPYYTLQKPKRGSKRQKLHFDPTTPRSGCP